MSVTGKVIVMPGMSRAGPDIALTAAELLYAAGADTGLWTVLYSEPTMHEALLMVPFALGLTDLGTVTIERLPIKPVPIDGIAPTPDNLANGRYPFTMTLGFVWREDMLPDSARAFLEFVRSDDGARILRSHGYLPLR